MVNLNSAYFRAIQLNKTKHHGFYIEVKTAHITNLPNALQTARNTSTDSILLPCQKHAAFSSSCNI